MSFSDHRKAYGYYRKSDIIVVLERGTNLSAKWLYNLKLMEAKHSSNYDNKSANKETSNSKNVRQV